MIDKQDTIPNCEIILTENTTHVVFFSYLGCHVTPINDNGIVKFQIHGNSTLFSRVRDRFEIVEEISQTFLLQKE